MADTIDTAALYKALKAANSLKKPTPIQDALAEVGKFGTTFALKHFTWAVTFSAVLFLAHTNALLVVPAWLMVFPLVSVLGLAAVFWGVLTAVIALICVMWLLVKALIYLARFIGWLWKSAFGRKQPA